MGIPNQFLGQWRSIEFELIFKSPKAKADFITRIKDKPYNEHVSYAVDYSIHPEVGDYYAYPCEVILSYRAGQEDVVKDFCRQLKGLANINASCGTHVHFDMRHVDEKTALLYGARLSKTVPVLRALLPQSRRENKFCRKDINTIAGPKKGAARYAFINMKAYHKYKTIEVRGHSGTINASKILNWIALCETIMTTEKLLKAKIKTAKTLLKHYTFRPEIAAYIQNRYDKFKIVGTNEED
jgi:hypothetical protein